MLLLITGCSGGGKSTLVQALAAHGYATVEEPGRRIVAEEEAGDGAALPWVDMRAFARRAVRMARDDLAGIQAHTGPVFFDRGLVDAAVALNHSAGVPLQDSMLDAEVYDDPVFVAPPWPDIFCQDEARRHDLNQATAEYARILSALDALGHKHVMLPKRPVADRVKFVLGTLGFN